MRLWANIEGVALDEETGQSWIQALTLGKYKHPLHGEITIDETRAMEFANNVNSNVRGTDLDVDYDHKKMTMEAAGWIKGARYEPGKGVFVLVEWTKDAAQKIKNKAYRYFSPEFVDNWTHPKTGATHKNVLLGGALTNRPFLKDILPINLSEILEEESSTEELNEGDTMDPKLKAALIKRFGLAEDATDEQVQAAIDAAPTSVDLSKAKVEKNEDGSLKITADGAEGELVLAAPAVQADEGGNDDLKQLAETNPAIAKLLADQEAQAARLADMEKAAKLSEVTSTVAKFDRLPPVVADQLRTLLVGAPTKLSEDIVGVITKLHEVGLVPQGQKSGGRKFSEENGGGQDNGGDAVTVFLSEVDSVMEADEKLAYIDAVQKVRETKPQMYSAYEAAIEGVEA